MTHAAPADPPLLICLPGLATTPYRSGAHLAELLTLKATRGPGTYAVEATASPSPRLVDSRRMQRVGTGPVLDVATLDYRSRLRLSDDARQGLGPALRRMALALVYLVRVLTVVLPARRRAKSRLAKWQLVIGLGAVVVLVLSSILTVFAVLAALGVWSPPNVTGTVTDAFALGVTAFTTWLLFAARPGLQAAADIVRQLLHYAEDQRYAAGVAAMLAEAVDDVLEAQPGRRIHLLAYSFGGLVALDFLFPRVSHHDALDQRHPAAIATLTTLGCPVDFIRLYVPRWTADRQARVPDLDWLNVFIAADVLGSNFVEKDDVPQSSEVDRDTELLTIAGRAPVSVRYTDERLSFWNVWGRKGFLSHGGYWGGVDEENCLHLVTARVLPPTEATASVGRVGLEPTTDGL